MSATAFDDDADRDTTDPGIIPGGLRDRAMRAVFRSGPKGEDKDKTRASQEYWAALKHRREPKGVSAEVLRGAISNDQAITKTYRRGRAVTRLRT